MCIFWYCTANVPRRGASSRETWRERFEVAGGDASSTTAAATVGADAPVAAHQLPPRMKSTLRGSGAAAKFLQSRIGSRGGSSKGVGFNLGGLAEPSALGDASAVGPEASAPIGGREVAMQSSYEGGFDEVTSDGRIRHKSITPMHQNAGTGTWVRRGSSWEDAHSEENTKREDLVSKTMRGLAKRETNAKGPMRSKGRKAPR